MGHLWQTIGYGFMTFLGLIATIYWIKNIAERVKQQKAIRTATRENPPSTESGRLVGTIDIKLAKGPAIIRMLIATAAAPLVLVFGIIGLENLADAGAISYDMDFALSMVIIAITAAIVLWLIFCEIPKLLCGFRKLRFDFVHGILTRYDYPKRKIAQGHWRHLQVKISAIGKIEDMGDSINVVLSEYDPDMPYTSFVIKTGGLVWDHDEILGLFAEIVGKNSSTVA